MDYLSLNLQIFSEILENSGVDAKLGLSEFT